MPVPNIAQMDSNISEHKWGSPVVTFFEARSTSWSFQPAKELIFYLELKMSLVLLLSCHRRGWVTVNGSSGSKYMGFSWSVQVSPNFALQQLTISGERGHPDSSWFTLSSSQTVLWTTDCEVSIFKCKTCMISSLYKIHGCQLHCTQCKTASDCMRQWRNKYWSHPVIQIAPEMGPIFLSKLEQFQDEVYKLWSRKLFNFRGTLSNLVRK